MAPKTWLLVEWVEENSVFPSYSVVNVDTFKYSESDIIPGEFIFLSIKQYNGPRRAKIIKRSDNKEQLKEHQQYLERQDQHVKNLLQVCMRTIKEVKSEQYENIVANKSLPRNKIRQSNAPFVINANTENSASESDPEEIPQNNNRVKHVHQTRQKRINVEPKGYHKANTENAVNKRRTSIICSTPVPDKGIANNIVLSFDQGTQTEENWRGPPTAKIEELELVLKHLYARFQSLLTKVNTDGNGANQTSDVEQNDEVSYNVEENDNDSWAPRNEVDSALVGNAVDKGSNIMDCLQPNEPNEEQNREAVTKAPIKIEGDQKAQNENSRVRRMSAQTTYSNDMVPIGNGHAMVPSRLLNEIDWQSYTTATRQLLQSIFPRKVLATHSLTGKQSPAHRHKPAKKLLDPNLVNDIIMTVSSKSGVSQSLVRNTITIKCTDEAKLYRNRQQYRLSRAGKKRNDENLPPSQANSSDESAVLTS